MKSKRISPLDNSNNNILSNNNQSQLNSSRKKSPLNESIIGESLILFSCDKEDLLNKWIVVLNYFINK